MKKYLASLLLSCFCLSAQAYYVDYATMTNYVANALSGFSPTNSSGASTPGIATNAPTIYWTNNVASSFWITNANLTLNQVGLPSSNQYSSLIIISNSGSLSITSTLPFTAYSLSMATNVVGAVVPPGTALSLGFYDNPNGVIYVVDNGQNNLALISLAAAVQAANGVLLSANGTVSSTTNVVAWSFAAQNAFYGNYYNNYPNTFSGIQFQAFDSLGNVWMNLWNRGGANGMVISNATLDLADMAQFGNSGAQGNDRFEHRTPNLTFAANSSGERQFLLSSNVYDAFGASAALISTPLYDAGEIASNLTSTAGFITNGNLILCTTTNIYVNTNYHYVAMIGAGGFLYFTTNNGVTNVWLHR